MNRTTRRTAAALAVTALVVSLAAACGPQGITADTTCRDYLSYSGSERYDAAIRPTSELGTSDAGNPMWSASLDYYCGQSPERTIREVLAGQ